MNDEREAPVDSIEFGILAIYDDGAFEGDNQNDEKIHFKAKIASWKRNRDTMLDYRANNIPDSFQKHNQGLAQQPDHGHFCDGML